MPERILLIKPPHIISKHNNSPILPPLGLAYLAAALEREHYYIKIIDAVGEGWENRVKIDKNFDYMGISWCNLKKQIMAFEPDVIGISWAFSNQEETTKKTSKLCKEINPKVPVVVGGAHPSAVPADTLKNSNIDFVIIGEGEETLVAFLKKYRRNDDLDDLDGFAFKKDGRVVINPKTKYIEDLDSLPEPARHLLPMEKYFEENKRHPNFSKRNPVGTMITSRGCPGKCIFCSIHSVWGHKWRARSSESVVDEIEHLVDEYGVKEIHFEDDNLTLDSKRAERIFDLIIDRNINISWRPPNGIAVNTLTKNLLHKMKRSGCYQVSLGLESGNPHILNDVIKKFLGSIKHAEQRVKWIKDEGIEVVGFFILGVPGETIETIHQTVNWAIKLDLDDAAFYLAQPYPGTELYKLCQDKGYLRVRNLAQLETSSASIETPLLSLKGLEKLQRRAYIEFGFAHAHPGVYTILKKSKLFKVKWITKMIEVRNWLRLLSTK